jgi:4-diphosphocytidyl-2-C-methyl-D-erythritol kinase
LATGRGELFEPVDLLKLKDYKLAVITPGVHISTAWAFGRLKMKNDGSSIKEVIAQPVASWRDTLVNDFEEAVFEEYPVIRDIKDSLYANGAIYASLSGSGSAVYGLFEKGTEIKMEGVKVFDLDAD